MRREEAKEQTGTVRHDQWKLRGARSQGRELGMGRGRHLHACNQEQSEAIRRGDGGGRHLHARHSSEVGAAEEACKGRGAVQQADLGIGELACIALPEGLGRNRKDSEALGRTRKHSEAPGSSQKDS